MSATTLRPRHAETTEWGPAKHDPEHPLHRMVDLRDADAERPDDN